MVNKVTSGKDIVAYSKKGNPVGEATVEITTFGYGQPMKVIKSYRPYKSH